jgi:hypothetical protein
MATTTMDTDTNGCVDHERCTGCGDSAHVIVRVEPNAVLQVMQLAGVDFNVAKRELTRWEGDMVNAILSLTM